MMSSISDQQLKLNVSSTMEDELKCPVCHQLFKDPIILQCNHNMCYNCAETSVEQQIQSFTPDRFSQGIPRSETLNITDSDKYLLCSSTSDSDSGYSVSSTNESGRSVAKMVDNFEISNRRSVTMPILPKSVSCISCPVCVRTLFLDDRGIEGLPKNKVLKSIVDRYQPEIESKLEVEKQLEKVRFVESIAKPSNCEMCENEKVSVASVKCTQCDVSYCSACLETFHPARGPLAKHSLKPLTQAAIRRSSSSRGLRGKKPEVPKRSVVSRNDSLTGSKSFECMTQSLCQQHPTESSSLYCNTCHLSLCVQCHNDGRHQTHDLQPIGITFKMQKGQLSQHMSALSCKARKAKDLVENLRLAEDILKKKACELEEKTTAQLSHALESVERKRNDFIKQICREKEMKSKSIKEHLQQCTLQLKQTTGLLEYCIEVMKEKDPSLFLLVSKNLIERVSSAENCWKSKYFVKEISTEINLQLDIEGLMGELEKLQLIKPRAPSAPLIEVEQCSSNNNTVTIGWKLPNDSISVNGYRLEMDDGNNGKFREVYKGLETLCTVDGLHFNSTYRAQVRAVNPFGQSPFSKPVQLQTAEVATFHFEKDKNSNSTLLFSSDDKTLSCHGSDTAVCFGNVAFSKGSHYWEFSIDSCKEDSVISLGIARADVNRFTTLGQDNSSWAICCNEKGSWNLHSSRISNRLDKSIQQGSKVGMFLHFATNTLTFFLDGKQHGDPINFYSRSKTQTSIFYPAVSLNNGSQVTLHTGMHCPQNHIAIEEKQIYRAKINGSSEVKLSQTSNNVQNTLSHCNGMRLLRNFTKPSLKRGNSAGDMNSISSGDSFTTATSDPTSELSSFRSFFKRR